MQNKSVYKVPNGKLLKVQLDYDEHKNTINSVKITGDFFIYPEEAIDLMENELQNICLTKNEIIQKINKVIEKNNIQFIGLTAEGLTTGILMCVDKND